MKKTTGTVFIVIAIIGMLFAGILGGGFFIVSSVTNSAGNSEHAKNEKLKDEYIKTKGRVSDVYDGKTYIEYEDEDGEEYEISLNVTSSKYNEGTKVTVYYDEFDPYEAIVPEIDEFAYGIVNGTFNVMGIIFVAISGIPAIIFLILGIVLRKAGKKEELYGGQY